MSNPVSQPEASSSPQHGKWWQRLLNSRFFFISVGIHLLFGIIATYLVIQNITAKRKLTFNAPPPSTNAGQKAIEHQVQIAQKRKSMSAPTLQTRRVTTTGISKVALPDMPAMPSLGAVPSRMSAPGGGAVSFGGVAGPIGGGPIPFFGFKTADPNSFVGTFYDLKQSPDRKPTGMTPDKYSQEVLNFVKSGWNRHYFDKYFKSPDPIYATQIFTPDIDAAEGPKAFGLEKIVKPSMWLVHYRARISPPRTGKYHFVGAGDDIMLVRFNSQLVLSRCWYVRTGLKTQTSSALRWGNFPHALGIASSAFACSMPFYLSSGQYYDIEVLIGEQPGGRSWAELMFEEDGVHYQQNAQKMPLYPILRVRDLKLPKGSYAPHAADGPLWRALPPRDSF